MPNKDLDAAIREMQALEPLDEWMARMEKERQERSMLNIIDPLHLLTAAKGWASEDDWGVPTITINILEHILALLRLGHAPEAIAAHAKHVQCTCPVAKDSAGLR